MESFVIKPKNKTEFLLLAELFKKMKIENKVLTDEEQEDFGLLKLMKEADRTEKVSREKVFAKLSE